MYFIIFVFNFQCEKLEERRYESIVVTVSQDSHWMTGSEKGKTFLEDKLLFISEFVQFCEGKLYPQYFCCHCLMANSTLSFSLVLGIGQNFIVDHWFCKND